MFLMTIELSALENKVKDLTQELALAEKERLDEQSVPKYSENTGQTVREANAKITEDVHDIGKEF